MSHLPLVSIKASHQAAQNRPWRSVLYLLLGEAVILHCKGICIKEGEEFVVYGAVYGIF
jgi:hypothetical protein